LGKQIVKAKKRTNRSKQSHLLYEVFEGSFFKQLSWFSMLLLEASTYKESKFK